MPNWGSLSNIFLVELESSGILITCPSHHILSAFVTGRMYGSPYSSETSWIILLFETPCSKTSPKMVQRMRRPECLHQHAQSVCIPRSNGLGLVSVEDHRTNQCAIYLTFRVGSKFSGSQQSVKPIVCTIPLHNASLPQCDICDKVLKLEVCPTVKPRHVFKSMIWLVRTFRFTIGIRTLPKKVGKRNN